MEHGLISFFELEHCGFYCKNGSEYEHVEGSVEDMANSFCKWVKDRDFNQTIPWDVDVIPTTNIGQLTNIHFLPQNAQD